MQLRRTDASIFFWAVFAGLALALSGANNSACAETPVLNEAMKLTASDAATLDYFGYSVDISGDRAIVGAVFDDDSADASGSAYIFDVTTGIELFKLNASDAEFNNNFGDSVTLDANRAIVGSPRDDDNGSVSGSIYFFDASTGVELFKRTASDGAEGDFFGGAVALDGPTAIIAAQTDDNDNGGNAGAAYLVNASDGVETFKLTASDGSDIDFFGRSVGISGNRAIAGSVFDDDDGNSSGSVYIFDTNSGADLHKLTASDAAEGDQFGNAVAIDGGLAIVGAVTDANESGNDAGAAYVFDVTTGAELFKLTASDGGVDQYFGGNVAIEGHLAVISSGQGPDGAAYVFDLTTGSEIFRLQPSDPTGNGDIFGASLAIDGQKVIVGASRHDGAGEDAGAAYVFLVPEPSSLGLACLGVVGA
ncbi:MAG: hypothetical protein RJP95_02760, partial [Pirellulales bacterium]